MMYRIKKYSKKKLTFRHSVGMEPHLCHLQDGVVTFRDFAELIKWIKIVI